MTVKTDEITAITRDTLNASHPDLVEAIRQEGYAAGAAAETARVKAVKNAALPGHEALIEGLMFDGKTDGGEAAAQVIAAERAKSASALSAMQDDAAELNTVPEAETADAPVTNLETEAGRRAAWEVDANARSEFGTFEAFDAYHKNFDRHSVLGQKEG